MKNILSKTIFSLRFRLVLLVAVEMVASVLVAVWLSFLIPYEWKMPIMAHLIVVSLLVGIVVTVFMSRVFLSPVNQLRLAMGKVAEGDFNIQLHTKSNSREVQDIYAGFNLMTQELRSMDILQTDFVSNVSHEFKTPITAIEGYSTLLQGSEDLDENQREYVDKILRNTQRLSTLVGSILLLSKLENQQITTNKTRYRLDEQIRQSVVALEPEWEQRGIEVDVELERAVYLGNEAVMRHVWDNLISNAVKFSPEGGSVRLRLVKKHSKLIFTVEDQGPGVSEEAKKHLFDKFYQGDSSHKEAGNGLGLALVKRILVLESGQISVENCPTGGCCFTVTLPQ